MKAPDNMADNRGFLGVDEKPGESDDRRGT